MTIVHTLLTLLSAVIWPFAKEWLLGLKDHPYNEQRDKKSVNPRSLFITTLAVLINLGFYTMVVMAENTDLKKKLAQAKLLESTSKSTAMSSLDFTRQAELKYDVLECTKRFSEEQDKVLMLTRKESLLQKVNSELSERLSAQAASCGIIVPPPQLPVPENEEGKSLRDRLRRLESE